MIFELALSLSALLFLLYLAGKIDLTFLEDAAKHYWQNKHDKKLSGGGEGEQVLRSLPH